MGTDTDIAIAWVALVPFLAALLAPTLTRVARAPAGWVLALVPLALFVFLLSFVERVVAGETIIVGINWVPSLGIGFSFLLDGLSLLFGLLISGIGTLIIIYAGGYMRAHPHAGRFFSFMLMFMGSMLGLVLADDLLTLFAFWELTSITSFLLIGFDASRQAARRAAIQALVITGGGGLVLLLGFVVLMAITGDMSLSALLAGAGDVQAHDAYLLAMLLIIGGAFAKSAQFPLHFWLPNAMEAPTPVSAFLHSATMVKAGVYLLARMNPVLGGTGPWFWVLVVFGSVTLLVGAVLALRQTDLKQMLAYTTMGSLGLLVLLIGVGSETALLAMVLYLAAHALFKAAMFMIAGAIDHGTGTREITLLGGLREHMPVTFLVAILAALSMAGLPVALGFFAKEEMYLALTGAVAWQDIVLLAILVVGNALMMAVALTIAIRPFIGDEKPTPHAPHEAGPALLAGPVVLGVAGLVVGLFVAAINTYLLAPVGSAIAGAPIVPHLALVFDLTSPALWASIATWGLGALLYLRADALRSALRRAENAIGLTFDKGFDAAVFGLIGAADRLTRRLQHGQLDDYMLTLFLLLIVALYAPVLALGGWPALPAVPGLQIFEWGAILLTAIGVVTVAAVSTRLHAIIALGVQGFGVAVIFMLFSAPDLSFTQFMVEILSVVILTLVMTRLRLDQADPRSRGLVLRDAAVGAAVGLGVVLLLLAVLQTDLDLALTAFFNATSVPLAHGRNIVNVILVDYRAIDTLGEVSVVLAAGLAILALIRVRTRPPAAPAKPKRAPRQRKTA